MFDGGLYCGAYHGSRLRRIKRQGLGQGGEHLVTIHLVNAIDLLGQDCLHAVENQCPATNHGHLAGAAQQVGAGSQRQLGLLAFGDVLHHTLAALRLPLRVQIQPAQVVNPPHLACRGDDAVLHIQVSALANGLFADLPVTVPIVRVNHPFQGLRATVEATRRQAK